MNDILEQQSDTRVLLGSRNAERGALARQTLIDQHPEWSDRVEVLEIDVSSDTSVTAAAALVASKSHSLYGIVNNAGVGFGVGNLSDTLQVNTYGVRRVCEAFVPLLAPAGRIVNITSAAGPNFVSECSPEKQAFFVDKKISWANLDSFMAECVAIGKADEFAARGLGNGDSYGLSKACANSYTLLLASEHPALLVSACTPGFIETDLTRAYAKAHQKSVADMGLKTPAEGTRSAMFALFEELAASGYYYGSDAKRSPLDRYRAPGAPEYTEP